MIGLEPPPLNYTYDDLFYQTLIKLSQKQAQVPQTWFTV